MIEQEVQSLAQGLHEDIQVHVEKHRMAMSGVQSVLEQMGTRFAARAPHGLP